MFLCNRSGGLYNSECKCLQRTGSNHQLCHSAQFDLTHLDSAMETARSTCVDSDNDDQVDDFLHTKLGILQPRAAQRLAPRHHLLYQHAAEWKRAAFLEQLSGSHCARNK